MTTYPNRSAEWGHWGICFVTERSAGYGDLEIHGHVYFPVGSQGPQDGPRRDAYRQMIAAWMTAGELPAELTRWAR